jgi:hypothetical protein
MKLAAPLKEASIVSELRNDYGETKTIDTEENTKCCR